MSDDTPITRKTRRKLDRAERDRLIAEMAAFSPEDAAARPETEAEAEAGAEAEPPFTDFVLPHVTAPEGIPPENIPEDPAEAGPAGHDTAPPEPAPDVEPESEPEPEPDPQTAPDTPAIAAEPLPRPGRTWKHLDAIPVDPAHLERNLIITASRHDPAHGAFDVLRTRLVQTLLDHGWKRVAITSPTRDCGKTFTAVNLAISLSRYESNRTVLMDMDMRNPSVAHVLGAQDPGSMGDFLQGRIGVARHFKRLGRNALNIGSNLAVAMNGRVEPYAAEIFQDPVTEAVMDRMMDELDPDIVLYDLPPALAFDDVIAFKGFFDGVLMVVGGGLTKPDDVREVMRRLGEDMPLLGVVLNQAEGEDPHGYTYGY